jgi:peptidyl-prolyl cis-trans isomerase D
VGRAALHTQQIGSTMLDSLRKASSGWVAKLLLGLLVISFAVWGVSSSMLTGPQATTVLQAGDASVSPVEYRLAYDRQIRAVSQQFGQRLTREQAQAFGIDQQVIQQLSAGALLDNLAKGMSLGITDDNLAQLTAQDPSFFNSAGQFDRAMFDRVLREVGMRPEDYLNNRAQVARRQQIVDSAGEDIAVPSAFLDALSIHQGETRDVSFIALPQTLVQPVALQDGAKLAEWFEENKAKYAFPEFRGIRYLKLEPEDLASQVTVTDEELRADYDANIARHTVAETRVVQQLLFSDRAAADTARSSLDAGKTFDDLIAAQGKTAADATLGTLTKEAMTDAALAEAAFAVPSANGVTPVVDGAFGPAILRVTVITPPVVTPFDQVKEQIRSEIQLQRAADSVLEAHDAYEDARAGGDTMVQAAEKTGLKIVEVPAISRTSLLPDGTIKSDLPASSDLLRTVFEAEIDAETPPINLGASGFLWAEATSVQPARDATFEEVRAKVEADWLAAETARLLGERANALLDELKGGKALADIATALSLNVETAPGLSRNSDAVGLGAAGVEAAFAGLDGHKAVVLSANGDAQILLMVDKANRPTADAGRVASETERLSQAMSDDLLDQLINRLQLETPVTVNQAAIDRALNF